MKPIGRPSKYINLIKALEDDEIYTPASISNIAERYRYFMERDAEKKAIARRRIRITMGRFSNNHEFPDEGDGFLVIPGQSPTPGWFGWRWKMPLMHEKKVSPEDIPTRQLTIDDIRF